MEWTIQDYGALGELVGGLAVVATLLYVGLQLRQNTLAVRSATMQSVFEATERVWENNCQDFARTEQIVELARKPTHTYAESFFLTSWGALTFRAQENIYYQRRLGTVDQSFVSLEERVLGSLSNPVYRRAWDEGLVKPFLSDEYVDFVERTLAQEQAGG